MEISCSFIFETKGFCKGFENIAAKMLDNHISNISMIIFFLVFVRFLFLSAFFLTYLQRMVNNFNLFFKYHFFTFNSTIRYIRSFQFLDLIFILSEIWIKTIVFMLSFLNFLFFWRIIFLLTLLGFFIVNSEKI